MALYKRKLGKRLKLQILREMKQDVLKDYNERKGYLQRNGIGKRLSLANVASFGLCTTYGQGTIAKVMGLEDDRSLFAIEQVSNVTQEFTKWWMAQRPRVSSPYYEEVATRGSHTSNYWWKNNSQLRLDFLYNLIREHR